MKGNMLCWRLICGIRFLYHDARRVIFVSNAVRREMSQLARHHVSKVVSYVVNVFNLLIIKLCYIKLSRICVCVACTSGELPRVVLLAKLRRTLFLTDIAGKLSTRTRILLENLTVAKMVKKLPGFFKIPVAIALFKRARK